MIARRTGFAFTIATLTAPLLGGCGDVGGGGLSDGGHADVAETSGDAPANAAFACVWQATIKELALPQSETAGVLRGASHNASTTCTRQRGTGGPDIVYGLRIKQRQIIDVEVVSQLDTVVAIRRACDDPLTEVACADDPLVPSSAGGVDAGLMPPVAPPPAGSDGAVGDSTGRDGHLRTVLEPGVYYVLVDEAEPFGVGGDFTLRVIASAPPAQATCGGAMPVMDGTSLAAEDLGVANQKAPSCGGTAPQPALFYAVRVPPGQRLTARAFPGGGDRAWTPAMQLFKGCADSACLATDRAGTTGERVLRYVNNGVVPEDVILSVSSVDVVRQATFRLTVNIGAPADNLTCQSAREVKDGTVLRGQDLSEGTPSPINQCMGGGPTLFYKAKLLPRQTMTLQAIPQASPNSPRFPLNVSVMQSCTDQNCGPFKGDLVAYTNQVGATQTVIIQVSAFQGLPATLFDLMVNIPPLPGAILVSAPSGLHTTEAGGRATFGVSLQSAPTAAVTVALASSDPGEGAVSPTSLTFTSDSWDKEQTVTVTGIDDTDADGPQMYAIHFQPTVSADPQYKGLMVADVTLVNDDDEPGVRVSAGPVLPTAEWGGAATFSVALNRAPTAPVHVPLASSDATEGTVSPAELVFDASNWNQAHFATVTGVDDADQDGVQAYKIKLGPVTSTDAQYSGLQIPDINARNSDDEIPAVKAQTVVDSPACSPLDGHPVGADQGGRLYVAMICTPFFPSFDAGSAGGGAGAPIPVPPPNFDGGVAVDAPRDNNFPTVFVAASAPGGHDFAAAVTTGIANGAAVEVAGVGPGVAVMAVMAPEGVMFSRTEDAGAHWSAARLLVPNSSAARVAAAGDRVVLVATVEGGNQTWVSADGGKTMTRAGFIDGFSITALRIEGDSGAIVALQTGPMVALRRSTDGGDTFSNLALATRVSFGASEVGLRYVFVTDPPLLTVDVVPLIDSGMPRTLNAPIDGKMSQADVMILDPADNLTLLNLQADSGNTVKVWRLPVGGADFDGGRMLPSADRLFGGVALSPRAVAVATQVSGRIIVSVETWP